MRVTGWGTAVLVGAAAVRSGGSGVCRCSFGVFKSGKPTDGSESAGSGVVFAGRAGWRKIAPIGAAYIATRTVSPRPAHRYLTPLKRNAVSPNG